MMTSTLLEHETATETSEDDGLDLFCIALCWLDVTDAPYVTEDRGRVCPICDIADYCGEGGKPFDYYD